jgi:L-ascorbate metabolism protein UlaG (beta-lactamase superfamily)
MSLHRADRPSRRSLLAAAPALGTASVLARPTAGAATTRPRRPARSGTADLRWLGTAGWRVVAGRRTILVDPYLTRFDTGLAKGRFDPTTPLTTDAAAVDAASTGADTVLVSHTHWDHVNDVPRIATTTGAQVFGTLTTCHVLTSLEVPSAQLSVVEGDEELALDDVVLRVVAARHSRNARGAVLFPGVRVAPPVAPTTVADLPEGGTLGFSLDLPRGPRCLFLGASDFSDAGLRGLAPDVVTVPVPSSDATHAYVPRLLESLDHPRIVVPVHWDNFETPLANPPRVQDEATRVRLRRLVEEVRRVSPRSRVLVPTYGEPLDL